MLALTENPPTEVGEVMLKLSNVDSYYGKAQILFDMSLEVRERQVVAVIGANGAGKSTTLNVIIGRVKPASGSVELDGQSIAGDSVQTIVRKGITCVPQRRRIFPTMTVRENLEIGSYVRRHDRQGVRQVMEEVLDLFPVLARKANSLGGVLSGGEQQMLAIGRGLMAQPRVLLLDEPSMGLSPKLTTEMFEDIRRIADTGRTVLIVEQNAYAALSVADHGYVLENGRVALEGDAGDLIEDDYVRQTYLGA
ncbi:ABC transporter ATP-binding protein [Brucella pseudintermedia]|uniref:ABC transporter ATP-binding protein n=1 Tax=Brucella pseudintermedia TaxID=370111 RepID=A0ABY5UEP7_9HYPH|nr:ABC transporter ATP-binding protein [Brucella pseudintermedia]UWL61828.1 ABC transporter ATP-binding protein [Brucella pseudintermedia]